MRVVHVLVPLVLGFLANTAHAATFVVNSADDVTDAVCDATHCSLREAILAANADGTAGNRIEFDLPGATDIHPTTALPVITASGLTLDGLTQSGSSASPLIPVVAVLGNLCASCSGLRISGSDVFIEGLIVGQWANGIFIQNTSTGSVVRRSWIGLSQTGLAALQNGVGVFIEGDGVTIGGSGAGEGNVISGNVEGVRIHGAALGTTVLNNLIGLPANGTGQTACVPNTNVGVYAGGNSTVIGSVAAPNILVCNEDAAIDVPPSVDGVLIRGNRIGDPGGKAMITALQSRGIDTDGTNVLIGGTGEGNVFALNGQYHVRIDGGTPTVQGNFIGVDFDGATLLPDLPNDTGVHASSGTVLVGGANAGEGNIIVNTILGISAHGGVVTVIGNSIGVAGDGTLIGNALYGIATVQNPVMTIGGTEAGEGNIIKGSGEDGIEIGSGFSVIEIVGNLITGNGALGFDLGSSGPNPNDSQDADIGPNGLQNFPVVTSATIDEVTGTLHSNPSTDFFVDFYANAACDSSGFGEGETYLTSIALTTNSQGNASFADVPYGSTLSGTAVVTAMARRADNGATSEFSACRLVAPPSADIAVQIAPVPLVVDVGNDVGWDLTISNAGPNAAEVVELEVTLPAGATFLSAVPTAGSCSASGGVVTCFLGAITAGAAVNVAVDASLDGGGDVSLLASATTITQQPDLTDDSAVSLIHVNRPPTLSDATVAADEDVAEVFTVVAGDLDGDTLQWSLESSPANGVLSGTLPNVTYTPAPNFFGSDSFDVEVFDGRLFSGVATITLSVASVNDLPLADVDDYVVAEDGLLSVLGVDGVLSNDSDVEGTLLSAILVDDVVNGTLALQADGSFDYEPDPDFAGIETFIYRASDGTGTSSETSVSIVVTDVGDAPIAMSDVYSGTEDEVLLVATTGGLLANDVDVDSTGLVVVLMNNTSSGTLTLGADGTFLYEPDANFSGVDAFTYRVSDGFLFSSDVVVTLTIASVNDLPVAGVDDYVVAEDGVLSVGFAGGVLSNDLDVEGSMLSAMLVDDVVSGTLLLQADGSFDYEPDLDFSGTDTFTYRAFDGDDTSSVTSVSIVVTGVGDAPIAIGDLYDGTEDEVLVIDAASGLLANDVDADASVGLLVDLVNGATSGMLTLGADGGFVYEPDPDFSGVDTFTYHVSDGVLLSGDVVVTLTIAPSPDDPPIPNASQPADGAVVEDPIGFEWSAVSDVDGETVSYRLEILEESAIIASLETTGTTMTVTGDAVPGSGTYSWRVVAVDASGAESQPTPLRAFVIEGSGGGSEAGCGCSLESRGARASPSLFLLVGMLLLVDRARARRFRAKETAA